MANPILIRLFHQQKLWRSYRVLLIVQLRNKNGFDFIKRYTGEIENFIFYLISGDGMAWNCEAKSIFLAKKWTFFDRIDTFDNCNNFSDSWSFVELIKKILFYFTDGLTQMVPERRNDPTQETSPANSTRSNSGLITTRNSNNWRRTKNVEVIFLFSGKEIGE